MVNITKENGYFIFEVKGMHKLWALKNEIKIPVQHIKIVHQDFDSIGGWKGWRIPGTHIPSIITAGTFYLHGDKIFWDVMNESNSIIVELEHEDYKQLIIEVEDPAYAIKLLTGLI
jgi:hypothetical protein